MVLAATTVVLVIAAAVWHLDRRRLGARLLDDEITRRLPVDLAIWWTERAGDPERATASRRSVERVARLSERLGLDDATRTGIQLALVLPPGMTAEERIRLPAPTRRALGMRHARWDGSGIPREARGGAIPVEAQVLSLVDWLDGREGTHLHALASGLAAESGSRFAPELADLAARCVEDLHPASLAEAGRRFAVTEGALLCVLPRDVPVDPVTLTAVEQAVRAMVRPTDRVFCTDQDVIVWLAGATVENALAALRRMEPVVSELRLPAVEVGTVRCVCDVALADQDATSFTELLTRARERAKKRAA